MTTLGRIALTGLFFIGVAYIAFIATLFDISNDVLWKWGNRAALWSLSLGITTLVFCGLLAIWGV